MNNSRALIRRHPLVHFCALTIGLSFAAYLLPLPREAIPVVMVFIPALVALALAAATEGWRGVRLLLATLAAGRVGLKWVVIALALALVLRLAISLLALLLGWIPAIWVRPGGPASLAVLALVFFVFALPEELGWRGYALPKLLAHHSPLAAGLVIGLLWGSLHLALHLPGMMYAGWPLLATLLLMVSLSVLITWLYVHTGGNVLLASLFHAAQSFFLIVNEGIPSLRETWLMAGVYVAAVLIVVATTGPQLAQKPAPAEGQTNPPAVPLVEGHQ
jgi:membrane protease YdiL (CAAX protease family)